MEKKKEGKEDYATDDPTDTTAQEQEEMAKKRQSRNSSRYKPNFH